MVTVLQSIRRRTIRTVAKGVVLIGGLEITTHLPSEGRSSRFYHQVADEVVTPILRYISNPEHAHHLALQLLHDYPNWAPTHRPSFVEQSINVSQQLSFGRDGGDNDDDHATNGGDEGKRRRSSSSLIFDNPIGLAAGFDKDAEGIIPLLRLGFGFVEVGSVCWRPQEGNPSPRMFRLLEDDAIINRYGFNSLGVEVVKKNIQDFRSSSMDHGSSSSSGGGLLGINLGKNLDSETPLEDYQNLITELGPYADYLVINVSCPNITGIQDSQSTDSLVNVLSACDEARRKLETTITTTTTTTSSSSTDIPPLFVKLSPDLDHDQLLAVATTLMELKKEGKVDGIIVSNTTTERFHGLQSEHRIESGGLSGRPLTHKSTECIRFLYGTTEGQLPIIGVGGVFSGRDVMDKIKAGATVVQIYTGMAIRGPGLVSKIRHEFATLMKENGFRSIDQVIGLDHEEHLTWQKRLQKGTSDMTGDKPSSTSTT